jgi:hypothetical protein
MSLTSILLVLLSGLLGALVSVFVNISYHHRSEIRRRKLQVLEQLVGNRNDLKGQPFSEALNHVSVVFHQFKEVIAALKAFHEVIISARSTRDLADQKLLDLFKAMCKDLKIEQEPLTDNFFLQPFNVRQ